MRGLVDEERYRSVLAGFEYEAGHAIVWRDAICSWFQKMSGVPDAKSRVDHDPARIEAENMSLDGYQAVPVTPTETASGGEAVVCKAAGVCSASFRFDGKPGWYTLDTFYYDETGGSAQFRVKVGDQTIARWSADDLLISAVPNGDTETRRRMEGVALRPGDTVRIIGEPNLKDEAAFDYVRIQPTPLKPLEHSRH